MSVSSRAPSRSCDRISFESQVGFLVQLPIQLLVDRICGRNSLESLVEFLTEPLIKLRAEFCDRICLGVSGRVSSVVSDGAAGSVCWIISLESLVEFRMESLIELLVESVAESLWSLGWSF